MRVKLSQERSSESESKCKASDSRDSAPSWKGECRAQEPA